MELLPLHRCEEYVVKETAKLLNSEWTRSETARIHSLSADCKDDLPCSLVLLENAAEHHVRVIGHSRLSQVLGKPTAVIIESVIVVKDKRGCGLGRKIMDMTESYAAQLSYTTSHLSTHDKCKFYEHLGYVYSTPVSPAKASARLLKHKQISSLQAHFGENVTTQEPVTKHVNKCGRDNVIVTKHVNTYGSSENGVESAEKTEQFYRSPTSCLPENSSQKNCESDSAAASACSEDLSSLNNNKGNQETAPPTCAPPPPPPPPPPQMNHTAQKTIFWMMKELNKR